MSSEEVIKKQLENIPSGVRNAILRINSSGYIQKFSEKYGLRIDQAGALEKELLVVLLGLDNSSSFRNNLINSGKISSEIASNIARDISAEVFDSVRHELSGFYKKTQSESELKSTQVTDNATPTTSVASKENLDSASDIAKEKMKGTFRLPQTQSEYKDVDPYREPIK
jgi:hypothetical protein